MGIAAKSMGSEIGRAIVSKIRATLEFAVRTARIHEAQLALRYIPHTLDCKPAECVTGEHPCLRERQVSRIFRLKQELKRVLDKGGA